MKTFSTAIVFLWVLSLALLGRSATDKPDPVDPTPPTTQATSPSKDTAPAVNLSSVASNTTTTSEIGTKDIFTPLGKGVGAIPSLAPADARPADGSAPFSLFQNIPLLSSVVSTVVINNDPVLAQGNTILGKWLSLIELNKNDPNKITKPDAEINKDRVIIESLLKAHKNLPANTRQQYLLLLDLFKLAQIRNFNNGLKAIEARYPESIITQEREGSFDTKRVKNVDSYNRLKDDGKVIYGVKWYQRRLKTLENLINYFNKDVVPKLGNNQPPPLLTGIYETLRDGSTTYKEYEHFAGCMTDPTTDQCRGFITSMRSQAEQSKDKKKNASPSYRNDSLDRDFDDDYADDDY